MCHVQNVSKCNVQSVECKRLECGVVSVIRLCSPDNAIGKNIRNRTRRKWWTCHAKWHRRSPECCACHENCHASSENRRQSIAPAAQNYFWHVMKMLSQSATPQFHAKRSRAVLKTSKVTLFAELTIGTAIATSRGHLRTVADGCEHKHNVWRTQLNPHTPRVKREPLSLCLLCLHQVLMICKYWGAQWWLIPSVTYGLT